MQLRLIQVMVSIVALAAHAGCSPSRTIRSQSDFGSLQHSTGAYTGSYIIRTWSYIGTNARYDHFIYTHTHDNLRSFTHVRVARGVVHLGFESRPYRLPGDGVPVVAEMQDGRVAGFHEDRTKIRQSVCPFVKHTQ